MSIHNLISEAELAKARGVCVRTVQRERALRTGPAFIRLGRKIFYRPEAVETWLLAKEQEQPRAAGARK